MKKLSLKRKIEIAVAVTVLATTLFLSVQNYFSRNLANLPIQVDAPNPYSYVIDCRSSTYVAYNGITGFAESISNNSTAVIQYAIDETAISGGGSVYVRRALYSASVTLRNNAVLILEKGASGVSVVSVDSGATCDLIDYNGGNIQHFQNGVLDWYQSLATGALTNIRALNSTTLYVNVIGSSTANGVQILKLVVENGTIFPSSPIDKQAFYRSDLGCLYIYNGSSCSWVQVGTTSYFNLTDTPDLTVFLTNNGTTALTDDWNLGGMYGIYGAAWVNATNMNAIGNVAEGQPFPGAPSYTVYTGGDGQYYAKCANGTICYNGTSANAIIQAVATDAPNGAQVDICSGTYRDIAVTITSKSLRFIGSGIDCTILEPASGSYAFTFTGGNVGQSYSSTGYVEDMTIDGSSASDSGGICLSRINYAIIQNVEANVTGTAFYNYAGDNNRWIDCIALDCDKGFYSVGSSSEIASDMWYTNCYANFCNYGFYMDDSTNGYMLTSCGAGTATVAGYYLCGSWSGGWATDCWADCGTGDGWVITSSSSHPSDHLQLCNIWGRSMGQCGLVVVSSNPAYPVLGLQVTNGFFNNNGECGLLLEGYVMNGKFNVISDSNNAANLATVNATNVLIHNGPQNILFYGSQIFDCQGSNRKQEVRIVSDGNAPQSTSVEFDGCNLQDFGNNSFGQFGIANTSPTCTIDLYLAANLLAASNMYSIDSDSTGTVHVYSSGPWTLIS